MCHRGITTYNKQLHPFPSYYGITNNPLWSIFFISKLTTRFASFSADLSSFIINYSLGANDFWMNGRDDGPALLCIVFGYRWLAQHVVVWGRMELNGIMLCFALLSVQYCDVWGPLLMYDLMGPLRQCSWCLIWWTWCVWCNLILSLGTIVS